MRSSIPEQRITKDLQYMVKSRGDNKYENYLVSEYLKKDNLPADQKVFIPLISGEKVKLNDLPSLH